MNNDDRVVELLTEMLFEQKGMKEQIILTNTKLDSVTNRLGNVENAVNNLQRQQAKTNLAIGELRLSVMRLADRLEIIADHENRIDKLERTVFN